MKQYNGVYRSIDSNFHKIRFISALLLLALSLHAYSQTATVVSGHVRYMEGDDALNVSVMIKDKDNGTIIAYAFSDEKGEYKLQFTSSNFLLLISVSGMNIASAEKNIPNKTQIVDFTVKEAVRQLKEVVVKTEKISYRKDTINYLVSAFASNKDFVIGDVLKKMPGIDVSESGQISYQGKPINKFYIENLDLLNGRYGIATNNIVARDVASVQVLENHQPIKAMDSIRISDQAAINLKLKDKAKGTLSIMAQLGIGVSPFLRDVELTGMYFGRKRQSITTYKSNNAGKDLSQELNSFNSSLNMDVNQYTEIQLPSPPNIDKKRYFFNNSNAATINNLIKLGEDKELNYNIIYYNDHEKRKSKNYASYYIRADSTMVINEDNRSSLNENRLEGEFRYNENSRMRYLNNFLNIEGDWQNNQGELISGGQDISQRKKSPSLKVKNDFHLIQRRTPEKGFELHSQSVWQTAEQNLTVFPGLYPDLLNHGNAFASLRQEVTANKFVTQNRFTLLTGFRIGKIVMNPNAGLDIKADYLRSELYPQNTENNKISDTPDSLKNQLERYHFKPYAGTEVSYQYGDLKLNVLIPFSYNVYRLKNKLNAAQMRNEDRFSIEPSVQAQYELSPSIALNSTFSAFEGMNEIGNLYSGYLMQDYRTLSRYESSLARYRGQNLSLEAKYKDIIRMFFMSGNLTFFHQKNQIIYGQSFDNILLVSTVYREPNNQNRFAITGKASKGFDAMKLSTGLDVGFTSTSTRVVRQLSPVDYKLNSLNVKGKYSFQPLSFLNVEYNGAWSNSHIKIESQPSSPAIRTLSNKLNLAFSLPKDISLGANLEHYYNSVALSDRNLYFADLNLSYTCRRINWILEYTNIFNTRNYSQSFYDTTDEYRYSYRIRPANVMLKMKLKLK